MSLWTSLGFTAFNLEGTPKQFKSGDEIQNEWMFVFGFFSIPVSHATKKWDIFSNNVCRTESLQQRF